MSNETVVEEVKDESVVENPATSDNVDWKAKAAELEAEAAKQRKLKQKAQEERDELQKQTKKALKTDNPEVMEYVKKELSATKAQLAKYAEKAKNGAITGAATAKLTAMGINPEAIVLALTALDRGIISYDEETDKVDDTALSTAVSKLKSQHGFLFERSVKSPTARFPGEKSGATSADDKTISVEDWNYMTSKEQSVKIKAGYTIRE